MPIDLVYHTNHTLTGGHHHIRMHPVSTAFIQKEKLMQVSQAHPDDTGRQQGQFVPLLFIACHSLQFFILCFQQHQTVFRAAKIIQFFLQLPVLFLQCRIQPLTVTKGRNRITELADHRIYRQQHSIHNRVHQWEAPPLMHRQYHAGTQAQHCQRCHKLLFFHNLSSNRQHNVAKHISRFCPPYFYSLLLEAIKPFL